MQIKDQMREDVVPSLAKQWANILRTCPPAVCNECLRTMSTYFDWIDIGISSRILDIVMRLCKQPVLRCNGLRCVRALVEKGMVETSKVPLLKHILAQVKAMKLPLDPQLTALLSSAGVVTLTCANGPNHAWCVATANTVLGLWARMDPARADLWSPLNIFVERMVAMRKRIEGFSDELILTRVFRLIQYPKEYDLPLTNVAEDGSDAATFAAQRRHLLKIFMSIARKKLDAALQLLESRVKTLLEQDLATKSFAATESVLSLTYHMGEHWRSNARVQAIVYRIFVPQVLACPFPVVTWVLMDLIIRFTKTVSKRKELISHLFDFLTKRCLLHPQLRIRARACHCLLRITKQMTHVLQRHPSARANLFRGLQAKRLLVVNFRGPTSLVKLEDQLSLFEIAGNLTQCAAGPDCRGQRQHICAAVLKPNLQPLKQSFDAIQREPKRLEHTEFRAKYGLWVSQVLLAMVNFSKGLSPEAVHEHLRFFGQTLELGVKITKLLPRHEQLRLKLLVWFHRCIQFMPPEMSLGLVWRGLEVLVPAEASHAVAHTSDTLEILRFLGDLVTKYPNRIGANLAPLLDRTIQLVQLTQAGAQCDWDTIARGMCRLLSTILDRGCQSVFTSGRNEEWQKRLLRMLAGGLRKDVTTARVTVLVFTDLLPVYFVPSATGGGSTPQQQRCFKTFLVQWLIPQLFEYQLKHPRATVGERAFLLLVKSMIKFQASILKAAPPFQTWLGKFLAKKLRWSADVISRYIGALARPNMKDALQCLKENLHNRTK